MMNALYRSILPALTALFAALTLVACGGGGSGGGSTTASGASGNVAILLTDGPAEYFDEINVRVSEIELLSDGGRVSIFQGDETFNLLDLADDARLFAIRNDVPAGHYSKIRLTLLDLELVKRDDSGTIIETHHPHLPGNGKLDLNPRGDFYVAPGETLLVQIDMDANKSLHLHQTGNGTWRFRPVVFVDVISDAVPGKFVRLHGVVEDIEYDDREFELCNTRVPVRLHDDDEDDHSRGCVEVEVVDATSIFDEQGQPAGFGDLVEGEEATVYGRFRREYEDGDDDDYDDYDDDDYYDDDEFDDDDSDGYRDRYREMDDLELIAAVIELGPEGTFANLDGVAETGVDVDDRFIMTIDPNQGFVAGTQVEVQLQDGSTIVNRHGEPLGTDAIGSGVPVTVDGVLDIALDPDRLYAALVVVHTDAVDESSLTGSVASNPDGSCGLTVSTDGGDRSVRVSGAEVFLVSSDDIAGSSEPIDVDELVAGQEVDVYGSEGSDGCFEADTIIAYPLAI